MYKILKSSMAIEIERKYLVSGEYKTEAKSALRITQGYLCADSVRTVRVRTRGNQGFLTIKGRSNHAGISRYEWEKEIPVEEAKELLNLCEPGIIDKTRYYVDFGRHTFEVDEFHGDNEGLTMAEIELTSEDEAFEAPSWLGEEVTGDRRYYNSYLAKIPFTKWKK